MKKFSILFATYFFVIKSNAFVENKINYDQYIQPAIFSLSMVMMHDVIAPTGAARYFSYCTIGSYLIISSNNKTITPLYSIIKPFKLKQIPISKSCDTDLAALLSIYEAGKVFLPSGYLLQKNEDDFIAKLIKKGVDKKLIDSSLQMATSVVTSIFNWSKNDNYNKLSALIRYTPLKKEGYWYPTPPAYMEAVDPHWKIIRPYFLQNASQFKPVTPEVFSKDTTSRFYKLAYEVYSLSKSLTKDQIEIASFWDCNPFVVANSGHMSLGFKKISPGAHWMNITGIVCKKAKLTVSQSIIVHTLVAMGLHDAFISCWDEKYRSNRVRPETYINKYIDVHWQPILQTPPFPEYTSGHSVASFTAASILTYFLGNKFSYTDDTELMFDIKERQFNSFFEAANEAAISRLYGGIHYRDAITNGKTQGLSIGSYIVNIVSATGLRPFKIKLQ